MEAKKWITSGGILHQSHWYVFKDSVHKLKDTHPVLGCLRLMPLLSCIAEHQNYFGIDENLGPVAVSIRREKVEDAKEKEGSQFNYRVAFRTSEVLGAQGVCPGLGLGVAAWLRCRFHCQCRSQQFRGPEGLLLFCSK